jgi:hypothetical protein
MPTPTVSDLHVNGLLTNVLVAYIQSDTKFVANRVFPRIPVNKQSDIIPQWSRADMQRDEVAARNPGSAYMRIAMRNDTSLSYLAQLWGLEFPVADEQVANQDEPFDLDAAATRRLAHAMLIKRERDWVSKFFTTSVWTGSSSGSDLTGGTNFTQWDDPTSTPIEDVKTQSRAIEENTGFYPNTLVVSRAVWDSLAEHPDIVDRTGHHADRVTTADQVARLMFANDAEGMPGRVLVASSVYNAAQEGLSHDGTYIAGKHALLCYAAPSPGMYEPSAGYTFEWNGATASGQMAISTYRDEPVRSFIHRIDAAWDQKVIASVMGAFFASAVA